MQKSNRLPLILLFGLALALRLIYVLFAAANMGFERFSLFAPDSNLYLLISEHILSWHEMGSYGLFRVGPGYGLILAGTKLIFGNELIWPILLNVFLGALAPVMVFLLAYELFVSRALAVVAGLISAVSLTGIAASAHILTDQPFFTIHAASLVCFVRGYRRADYSWFVASGLLAGIAAYVRPIGVFWPALFLLFSLLLPLNQNYRNRWALVKRVGVAGLILLVMVWGWSARNYIIHDHFVYCSNGMLTVRSCLVAHAAQDSWGEGRDIVSYRTQWEAEDGDRTSDFVAAYDRASERVQNEIQRNMGVMFNCYLKNLGTNLTAPNYYIAAEIPQLAGFMDSLNYGMTHGIGYAILAFTLVGLVLLYRDGHKTQFWILGAAYFIFSITLGASFWQGSRLHYPAEMAWSIVLAYLAVRVVRRFFGSEKGMRGAHIPID